MGIDPRKIVNVALTPCTAKKIFEIRREEMNAAGQKLGIAELRDMDNVITTRSWHCGRRKQALILPAWRTAILINLWARPLVQVLFLAIQAA
mgnify:CR=1 FL=1